MMNLNFNTKKIGFFAISGIIVLLIILAFTTKEEENITQVDSSALEVQVATPVYDKITEWDEYSGRFEASNRVEVRARVSGFLEKVNFSDGQMVEKGQVLFVIDQRPFRIELERAKAGYEQALASLKTAEDNYNRVESLKETGALSTEEYDRRKQAFVHARASLELAAASVDHAKLNLEFTEVKAPISGLVSRDKVNEGNIIDGGSANSTLLTTIVATSPIHFYFTESESEYLKYVRLAKEGKRGNARSEGIPVMIKLSDEEQFMHTALLDFVDNEIDEQSGTIESRAVMDNNDHLLEPGMFGKARISGSEEHKALMIPDEIIGTNQSLRYVYVLDEEHKVSSRNLTLGPLHSNGLRIVRSGLQPKDQLIINNLQKIRPGMPVSPKVVDIPLPDQKK
ncbi:MAG: efflux transporter periplasmic adaptor subunit [Zunongwangia sp.]|uniref:efflux RND transporter periplasmic adaptor subunit n=1 Tax=Zunongwangia profunda TaxID=398743 RepID=UPI000C8CBAA1|nr:efflux RND transporter periplasmic adaptor subunit [Zunongwangia profunda]MAG86844.1 efflux transporter periplasmic adaptor subunit [Flavobacteriaceae bacterium]MAO36176.1 efflux transporter periplasmic adaptor subunit [Zunongwangia sp.]MCC4226858.1 efflux RND transporter periplasmic adaptor subunit [Zunongwangia profunda]